MNNSTDITQEEKMLTSHVLEDRLKQMKANAKKKASVVKLPISEAKTIEDKKNIKPDDIIKTEKIEVIKFNNTQEEQRRIDKGIIKDNPDSINTTTFNYGGIVYNQK